VGSSARSIPAALSAAYATNYGALAASGPFFALLFADQGFSAPEVAGLLTVIPLVGVVATPAWTILADRMRDIGAVVRISSAGALVAFALFFLHPPRALVPVTLVAFTLFRAPFGALLDAVMLHGARASGRSFSAVRSVGTAGYALGAIVTGGLVARHGSFGILAATTALLVAALLAALALRHDPGSVARVAPHDHHGAPRLLLSLGKRPRFLLLMAISLLSEIGLAPYDALFPAYLTKLSDATAAGAAVALGAAAEFLFLLVGPALAHRFGPERILTASCAASALRWGAIASVTSPALLVALQALHSLSFGAFYMSAVILMDRETPPSLRATGQGIFNSLTFGVAAALSLSVAGLVERWGGMKGVFGLGGAAAALATALGVVLSRTQFFEPPARQT